MSNVTKPIWVKLDVTELAEIFGKDILSALYHMNMPTYGEVKLGSDTSWFAKEIQIVNTGFSILDIAGRIVPTKTVYDMKIEILNTRSGNDLSDAIDTDKRIEYRPRAIFSKSMIKILTIDAIIHD